jgi:predicted nucleic acid-binding protein
MTFDDLLTGDAVFVDANVFTYHFQGHPTWGAACTNLLNRIENQDLQGFTSVPVLGEVAHRMMTIQAHHDWGWPFAGIGNRLRTHPDEVRKLTAFRSAVDKLLQGRLHVLTADSAALRMAVALCQQIGMLTNDALTVAVMQMNSIAKIASHDADFDRVPGITRYAPA